MMDYTISLDSYEGSIDTLHSLVRNHEIDLLEIPLAQILEEYSRWIKGVHVIDLDAVGDFLAIAAHLLLMKVRMLLPRRVSESLEDVSEDTGVTTDLQLQLLEQYKTFTQLAEQLAMKETSALRYYLRSSPFSELEDEEEEIPFYQLLRALKDVLKKAEEAPSYEVPLDEITLESKLDEIFELLKLGRKILFTELFTHQTRSIEMIITFIAVLELVRMRKAIVKQEKVFGEIWIYQRK